MPRLQLGILASGSGSNLQAILDAIADRNLDADARIVIANVPGAKALERAEKAGVRTALIPHRNFPDRVSFDAALTDTLREAGAEWVVLAGFMRVLTPGFIARHHRRILNIHPALLPAFPGVHAQAQALAYGAKVAGCTVHFVDEGVDCGPIIAQRAVPVQDDDSVDSLTARILREEHKLYVQVLQWLAAGRIRWMLEPEAARPRISIESA
jgi:phosphoribosylglycinamide formyltransferase-1